MLREVKNQVKERTSAKAMGINTISQLEGKEIGDYSPKVYEAFKETCARYFKTAVCHIKKNSNGRYMIYGINIKQIEFWDTKDSSGFSFSPVYHACLFEIELLSNRNLIRCWLAKRYFRKRVSILLDDAILNAGDDSFTYLLLDRTDIEKRLERRI